MKIEYKFKGSKKKTIEIDKEYFDKCLKILSIEHDAPIIEKDVIKIDIDTDAKWLLEAPTMDCVYTIYCKFDTISEAISSDLFRSLSGLQYMLVDGEEIAPNKPVIKYDADEMMRKYPYVVH